VRVRAELEQISFVKVCDKITGAKVISSQKKPTQEFGQQAS
jgi:hypothetical protein